jgi:hypothetical protein
LKDEKVDLTEQAHPRQAQHGWGRYGFFYYNPECPDQVIGYQTPAAVSFRPGTVCHGLWECGQRKRTVAHIPTAPTTTNIYEELDSGERQILSLDDEISPSVAVFSGSPALLVKLSLSRAQLSEFFGGDRASPCKRGRARKELWLWTVTGL